MNHLDNQVLNHQLDLFDRFNRHLHDPDWDVEFQRLLSFSDNLILGIPMMENGLGAYGLGLFLDSVASYQLNMTLAGRFVRGGIALGNLYIDNSFVTGEALVHAVQLEENVAIFPRIILSEYCAFVAVADSHDGGKPRDSPWNSQLLADNDGRLFIDYLGSIGELAIHQIRDVMARHRDCVDLGLTEHAPGTRVREKYRWAAEYHNFACGRFRLAAKYRVKPFESWECLYPRAFTSFAEHELPNEIKTTKRMN